MLIRPTEEVEAYQAASGRAEAFIEAAELLEERAWNGQGSAFLEGQEPAVPGGVARAAILEEPISIRLPVACLEHPILGVAVVPLPHRTVLNRGTEVPVESGDDGARMTAGGTHAFP